MKFFIVEARYHIDVADRLVDAATAALDQGGAAFERFAVPGILEIPAAVALAVQQGGFDGFVALGCVLGSDEIAVTAYRETLRGLVVLGSRGLCIGSGIIHAENERAALNLAELRDPGGDAARGALALVALRMRLGLLS